MHKFNNHEPIYLQLMNIVKQQIINGTLKKDEKISSVRELALAFGVNPNTVQKALSELEREGFIRTERTSGRYVALDLDNTIQVKAEMCYDITADYIRQMWGMNYTDDEIRKTVKSVLSKERKANE